LCVLDDDDDLDEDDEDEDDDDENEITKDFTKTSGFEIQEKLCWPNVNISQNGNKEGCAIERRVL